MSRRQMIRDNAFAEVRFMEVSASFVAFLSHAHAAMVLLMEQ
jgi:hypothetical protein